jgi:hypothetical protein
VTKSITYMLDQSSLKLLLRARAELVAAMFLIDKRIRQKQTQDLALALTPVPCDLAPSGTIRVRAMTASTHS